MLWHFCSSRSSKITPHRPHARVSSNNLYICDMKCRLAPLCRADTARAASGEAVTLRARRVRALADALLAVRRLRESLYHRMHEARAYQCTLKYSAH